MLFFIRKALWSLKSASLFGVPAFLLALSAVSCGSLAADIKLLEGTSGEPPIITLDGDIVYSDVKRFQQLALAVGDALVVLKSPGGDLEAGIEIGNTVRLKGFSTLVKEERCSSACALIWVAGRKRILGKTAAVGVHSSSVLVDGVNKPGSVGNALVGAYLGSLGLNTDVITFFTSAPPEEMNWLSLGVAQQLGLDVSVKDDDPELELARKQFDEALVLDADENNKTNDAVKLYWHSAQAGYAGAQNNLGDLYDRGSRVKESGPYAIYWYTRAAERGEPTAYLSLASILAEGNPDNAQLVEALMFAMLAATELPGAQNQRRAEEAKKALEKRLSQGSIDLARELAGKWRPLYQEKHILGDP